MSDSSAPRSAQVQERTIGSDLERVNDISLSVEEVVTQIMTHMNLKRDQGDEKEGSVGAVTMLDERFNQADVISRRLIETKRDLEHLQQELNRI